MGSEAERIDAVMDVIGEYGSACWHRGMSQENAAEDAAYKRASDVLFADIRAALSARPPLTDEDKAAVERMKLKATAEYDPYAKAVMVSVDDLKRVLAMVDRLIGEAGR